MGKLNTSLSFWEAESLIYPPDVCILGAGIVGLNAALEIKRLKPKTDVMVIERGSFPLGASTRNAGFACFGSVSELLDDLSGQAEDEVLELVELRLRGLSAMKQMLDVSNIDFQAVGNYEVFREADQSSYLECIQAIPELNNKLASITGRKDTFVSKDDDIKNLGLKKINHLILNQEEGTIHTGKMMKTLIAKAENEGIRILWGCEVDHFETHPTKVEIHMKAGWKISSQQVILATNGFSLPLIPEVKLKPARNQVLVTSEIPNLKCKGAFHLDQGYVYFRNIGSRILIGGGRNQMPEEETTADFGTTKPIKNYLLNMLHQHILPKETYSIEYAWSGILGIGNTKKPIIKRVNDRVIASVRLGGMGVAIGTLVGQQAAHLYNQ